MPTYYLADCWQHIFNFSGHAKAKALLISYNVVPHHLMANIRCIWIFREELNKNRYLRTQKYEKSEKSNNLRPRSNAVISASWAKCAGEGGRDSPLQRRSTGLSASSAEPAGVAGRRQPKGRLKCNLGGLPGTSVAQSHLSYFSFPKSKKLLHMCEDKVKKKKNFRLYREGRMFPHTFLSKGSL